MKKTNYITLIIGVLLTVVGVVCVALSRSAAIADGASASSTMVFALSLILTVLGIVTAILGFVPQRKTVDTRTLTMAAMFAALCYIGFWGGMAGAVGMTIADLTTAYVTSAPKTFILKLCIGLIVGAVAHKAFKITKEGHSKRFTTLATILSCAAGMAFNVVADPLTGYFYKMYIMGIPQKAADAWAKMGAATTLVNAVIAVVAASILYAALRPALKRTKLLPTL